MTYVRKTKDLPTLLKLPNREPADWGALVQYLLGKGYRARQIAVHCGVGRAHIRLLSEGRTEPHWYCGQRLIQIFNHVKDAQ